jgi:hypothetical protein
MGAERKVAEPGREEGAEEAGEGAEEVREGATEGGAQNAEDRTEEYEVSAKPILNGVLPRSAGLRIILQPHLLRFPRIYKCRVLFQAAQHLDRGAYGVNFGESGKNFIEIGKKLKMQESMLRECQESGNATRTADDWPLTTCQGTISREEQCRSANLEKAIWKSRQSD